MKKIISLLLALMMLVATFAVIVIPTSAVTGAWSVYTCKSQYLDGYSGVVHNIAGYKYTDEGLKTISPSAEESENTTPYVTVQTTEKVDIRAGVYMKVRVDNFTYEGDSLFSFSVWDQQGVEPGKQGDDYGYGAEMLIRPINDGAIERDEANKNTWAGATDAMYWYSDVEAGVRTQEGFNKIQSNPDLDVDNNDFYVYDEAFNTFDENNLPIFIFEIKWNSEKNICQAYINGTLAPDGFNDKMSDYFKPENYYAHIGFTMYNSALGGVAECTVLEFGESPEDGDWAIPDGDDSAEPEVFSNEFAEIAPATDVPEGDYAIRFTGDPDDSDIKGKPSAYNGNILTILDNGFVNVQAPTSGSATVEFRVKDDVSYDILDFPIVVIITKNLCTCEWAANDVTGELEKHCNAEEKIKLLAHAGANMASNASYTFTSLDNTYFESFVDSEDNSYLYFMFDTSVLENEVDPLSGRIHGARFDINGLGFNEAERNNFDVCEVAFFRNTDEAEDYAKVFIENVEDIGGDFGDDIEDDTEEDTEEDIEVDTEEDTDVDTEEDTDVDIDVDTDEATDEATEDNTDEATDEATEDNTDEATDEATEDNTDEATDEGTDVTPDTDSDPAGSGDDETEPETDEDKTTGKTDENTEAQTNGSTTTDSGCGSGCGSAVGFGAIAVAMTTAIALVSFRKKED